MIPGKDTGYVYDVYLGTDYNAVANATTASTEYQGQQSSTNYTPNISGGIRYFWRIDQVEGATTVKGDVWWFEGESISPLNDPAILNASVEDPVLASGATSNDINDWYDASSYTWTQDEGASTHPDTPYGDNWIELGNGRWIYQQIGTYAEDMEIDVSFLAGQSDGNDFGGITVELLAGGDPQLAADHKSKRSDASFALEAVVGASVIATSGQLNPFTASGQASEEMVVSLTTGTGHTVGDPLWLLLYRPSANGRSLIDNVQVVHTNAEPENGIPVFNANPISEEYGDVGKEYNSTLADNGADPDGDTLTYSKLSGPAWLIVSPGGELTGVPAVGDDGLNTFTVQVDDGNGGVASTQVEIEVIADTKAPSFVQGLVAHAGDGNVSLDWDDSSESDLASYTLYRSTASGSGYSPIAVGLIASEYSDDSAQNGTSYYYVVTATDTSGNESGYSSESMATPIEPNVAPVAGDASFVVVENTSIGASVGIVQASDGNASDSLQYVITAGNASGAFAIDSSTGEITTASVLDYEGENQYTLTVTVSDNGSPVMSDTANVSVTVSNENESPSLAGASGSVAENELSGTVIVSLSGTDPDVGDSLSYTITAGNESGLFSVDSNGDLRTTGGLNFESESQYILTVEVTDNGGLSAAGSVNITVIDVNESPTLTNSTVSISKDVSIGSSVALLSASDVDASDSLSYMITAGNTGNAFAINSNSGAVTTATALDYETLSQYILTVVVTDSGGLSDSATLTVDITDVFEVTAPVVSTGSASALTQTSAEIAYTVVDDGGEAPSVTLFYGESDGGQVAGSWESSVSLGAQSIGVYSESLTDLSAGTDYYFTVRASNSEGEFWGSSGSFTTEADTSPKLVRTLVSGVSSTNWVTVDLGQNYDSAVVVATPIYPDSSGAPVVTRIRNVSGSSFDLKLDRVDGQTAEVHYDVSVLAVEEGVYTSGNDGVQMEAVKFMSSVTARKSNWNGESRTYQNAYTNPVVLGQVMSANDARWSVFWSMGSSRTAPASASHFAVGKHVGEDSSTSRGDETVGYIVIESGNGTINGVAYEAGLGADLPEGVGETTTGWNYSLSGTLSTANLAVISQAAIDGNDGSWAVLYGASPWSTSQLTIAVDEDQLKDSERNHSNEQVGYLIFE
ncbi:cadherin domain-containing protein [Rubritalea tangerina]|uniref:Cadherin domain-containing protein n=1 Tax=Rubritalea tangerina TaxID=430798 RepID=A0ABW4Z8Q2_9BACT